MYKKRSFLAIIPARGGSKGIPKKNIIEIQGEPLISYTIKEAIKSKYIDKVIVSTDCIEIAAVAKKNGADVPFLRPEQLADDYAKSIDVLLHGIEYLEKKCNLFDYVILLQPTQPLRQHWHIDEAIEQVVNENQTSLVSISPINENPILFRSIDGNNHLVPLINQQSSIRRQDFKQYYKVNGSIYINKITENFNSRTSLNDNLHPYVMDKQYDLDIDNWEDLVKMKRILKNMDQ